MLSSNENNVAIIGAGLYGLVTAKVLLRETNNAFSSITVFEKQSSLGGVWSKEHIYPGLASNSPALTYEIPGFKYPEHLRRFGAHVEADDINTYINTFAETYNLRNHVRFMSEVSDVSWITESQSWRVVGFDEGGEFENYFKFVIVCNGLYHSKNIPKVPHCTALNSLPKVLHSADVGNPNTRRILSTSRHTLVVGAGKSAIDLATTIARGTWAGERKSTPQVTLVYKRPHWLSPRSILMGAIYFERVLFSRFLNAWLPFAIHPDSFHHWIAETATGKWITDKVFQCVEMDMKTSCGQTDLLETIPNHPLREALSGALHVAPKGYLDLVRAKKIRIVEGSVSSISESGVEVQGKNGKSSTLNADKILWATGYKIAFPFFTNTTLHQLGITHPRTTPNPNDLPQLTLYRLIVPPATTHSRSTASIPYRNIAFNGFAYSLLNPTVAYTSAHWIAEYFLGNIDLPDAKTINAEIEKFYKWQSNTFAAHGMKGVHIGSHATLYADLLLNDMGLNTGHVEGWETNPAKMMNEWFRPMYPQIYASIGDDKRKRRESVGKPGSTKKSMTAWKVLRSRQLVALYLSLGWIVAAGLIRWVVEPGRFY